MRTSRTVAPRAGRSTQTGRAARVVLGALLGTWPLAGPARAEAGTVDDCLECHDDNDEDEIVFPDGFKRGVDIPRKVWEGSVHAGEIGCTDCHTGISDHPHPDITAKTYRDYQVQKADTCKRCHYAQYTHVLDSIHYRLLEQGKPGAPTCVDCHGAHDVKVPGQPRIDIDRRCAPCHAEISDAYRRSVHGKALLDDSDPDVPVCTDCHTAHKIQDSREVDFHARSYQICAKCHSDKERMARHDLNPNVVDTYLDDFHGASNALYAQGLGRPDRKLATCTDCHGIHDIPSFKEVDTSVVRERVLASCRSCHEDVPEGFQDFWLSHYPPTLASAPLVWLVKWFYRIVIPLIALGLVLHILLHLWSLRFRRPGAHR